MKLQFSALIAASALLTACTGTGPINDPTPIAGPSDVSASASASSSASASTSSSLLASESEDSASPSASASSSTASSKGKGSESNKPKAKPSASSPGTVVSSDKADTTREGGPIDIAPSAKTDTAPAGKSTSSLISVTTKVGGKGTIKLGGKADVYEGTVIATATHSETGKSSTEFTTASCSGGCSGTWTINFSGLEPGTYKVNVHESDESDGEGKAPYSVDVTIKVS